MLAHAQHKLARNHNLTVAESSGTGDTLTLVPTGFHSGLPGLATEGPREAERGGDEFRGGDIARGIGMRLRETDRCGAGTTK